MSLEVDYRNRHDGKNLARVTADTPVSLSPEPWTSRFFELFFTKKNSLLFFVILPSLLGAAYYFGIASNQYVSETRMIVRTIGVSERFDMSEDRSGPSIIGGDSLTQDSYIVANYLESPELVRKLESSIGLRNLFTKNSIDLFSRLSRDASLEDLNEYWKQHVDTYVDGPSGIIVFSVRAFSPEESVLIANAALAATNEMIDTISEKAKNDLVKRGEHDVAIAMNDYQTALDQMRDYQNKSGILDPVSSAKMVSAVISKLTEEKLRLMVSLKSLEAAKADGNARGRELRRSIQAIDDQITLRQNSLAGADPSGETQLSSSMIEFSRLETRRIVTQAIYESTVRNLDTAKSTALKRTTFISIFSDSHLPEKSKYPDRLSQWFILTALLFTIWMTATLIWMSIEDHRV